MTRWGLKALTSSEDEDMTREEILAMVPGRELDALIAEIIMGKDEIFIHYVRSVPGCDWFQPSTNISSTWEVLEMLKRNEKRCFIQTGIMWCCEIEGKTVFCETAPEAICKAALLTVLEATIEKQNEETKRRCEMCPDDESTCYCFDDKPEESDT